MESTIQLPSLRQSSDSVDFVEIANLLRRRLWFIAAFVAAGTFLALLHVMLAIPVFTAHGALYLGDAQSTAGGTPDSPSNLGFSENFSAQSDVETEIELITSKAIVQEALMQTGLNAKIQPVDAKPLSFWRWRIKDGGGITAYLPGPDGLQALYASAPGSYTVVLGTNGTYRIYPKAGIFNKATKPILSGVLGQPASGNGVQLLIKPAGPIFRGRPGEFYNLTITDPGNQADYLLGGPLTVTAGGSVDQPTKIAFLQFRWSDPYQAQELLNQVMQDFIATQLSWKTQSASATEGFVASQLGKVSASLATADQNLADYQAKTGIVDVPQNAQAVITALAQYQTERSALQLQKSVLQELADDIQRQNNSLNPYLVSQTNDAVLAGLTSTLADAYVKLTTLQTQYTDTAIEVRTQEAEIDRLQYAIKTIVENDLSAAKKNLASLDEQIDGFQRQIKAMPNESLKVISLQRSVDVLGQLYVLLMEKEQEAEVSKAATIIDTRIVTAAAPPAIATSPKAAIGIIFGAFAGLVLGIGLTFMQRAVSNRYETEEQIRKSVAIPVFGTVPQLTRPVKSSKYTLLEGHDPFSEAFRLLRGGLYRNRIIGNAMIVLIISASESDGKTTIAVNLAKALADDGWRTVLVDSDLYRGPANTVVTKEASPWRSFSDGSAVSAFPSAPGERYKLLSLAELTSQSDNIVSTNRLIIPNEVVLTNIFSGLRNEFEFIILDCPPLPSVADGMTLGVFADLILSVISVSHTSRRSFAAHNELIALLKKPHGVIINRVAGPEYYRSAA